MSSERGSMPPRRRAARRLSALALLTALVVPSLLSAQVDSALARRYFAEAQALCQKEGGKTWGVSLCGPMVLYDAPTRTMATSEPAPDAPRPAVLGYANAALRWGSQRWSTFVWAMIPEDPVTRGRLFLHELFHRVQPELGLLLPEPNNEHLDTPDGRYWLQLEWRALARALGTSGAEQQRAVAEALGFRAARRARFPGAAENERVLEVNEGLAQYTGTVAGTGNPVANAIEQLGQAPTVESFVRSFAYPSGAAYGLLLDHFAPGWTRRLKPEDDLGGLLAATSGVPPVSDPAAAAARYDGASLRVAETRREAARQARVAALRKRFVDGPVLVLPRANNASFTTSGMTPIPGQGTIITNYRVTGDYGTLEAEQVLMSPDRTRIAVPAPASLVGQTLTGDGWTLVLAPGWEVKPGNRMGDYQVVPGEGIRVNPHE